MYASQAYTPAAAADTVEIASPAEGFHVVKQLDAVEVRAGAAAASGGTAAFDEVLSRHDA